MAISSAAAAKAGPAYLLGMPAGEMATPGAKGAGWAETQVVTAAAAQLTRHCLETAQPCSLSGGTSN